MVKKKILYAKYMKTLGVSFQSNKVTQQHNIYKTFLSIVLPNITYGLPMNTALPPGLAAVQNIFAWLF